MKQLNKLKIEKQNIGNAGEYYLASRLSAENFITSITIGRAEKIDIIAVSPKGRTIKLSVKTRYKEKAKNFPLSKKDESGGDNNTYYAFIKLNEFRQEPDYWVIPSLRVNEILKAAHEKYLNKLGKNNQKRVDVNLRQLWIVKNKISIDLFPKEWMDELKKYNKNIRQLF